MSFADGMAAMRLEMPERVPRTEYSAEGHWKLISRVTGWPVDEDSSPEAKEKAAAAFRIAWQYDFCWNICISGAEFGDKRTHMGHAIYAAGGVDYDENTHEFFNDPEAALTLDPWAMYGACEKQDLTGRFNDDYRRLCARYPDEVNTTGIYITCMSGLIDLFGWDMLLTMTGIDPRGMGELTNRYAGWIFQYFDALAACEAPVVMIHDDIVWTSGAFIHPEWYREFIFPNYRRLFKPLIDSGKRILFTSDGDYSEFIDDIASCGVNGFVMEPMTDMRYVAEKYGQSHVFIGNADTRILLSGTKEDIEREVRRCMDIGKPCPGFFMAVGNHIPPNTPVDNALYYNEVYEKLSRR
jgi:hypothetical protein